MIGEKALTELGRNGALNRVKWRNKCAAKTKIGKWLGEYLLSGLAGQGQEDNTAVLRAESGPEIGCGFVSANGKLNCAGCHVAMTYEYHMGVAVCIDSPPDGQFIERPNLQELDKGIVDE